MDIELMEQIRSVLDTEELSQEGARKETYVIHYQDGKVERDASPEQVIMAICSGDTVDVIDKTLGGF